MNEFLSVGYAVIDRIDGKEYYGGSGAGTAINAAHLGLNADLLAPFGTDNTSIQFLNYLHTEGVSTQLSPQDDHFHLPENTISHHDRTKGWNDFGLSDQLETSIIPTHQLSRFRLIHLTSAHFTWTKQIFEADHNSISFSPGPKVVLDQRYAPLEALSASDVTLHNVYPF